MGVKAKPLHVNHCNHPLEDFIESYAGADIHVYESIGCGRCFCVRYSSEPWDYCGIIRTLEEAREFARIREENE